MKPIYKTTQAERLNQSFQEANENILTIYGELKISRNQIAVLETSSNNPETLMFRVYNIATRKIKSHLSLNEHHKQSIINKGGMNTIHGFIHLKH